MNGVTYSLSWDYDGQLVGISGNGSTVGFGYDALGRRVSRTVNGTTTQFLHDSVRIVLELQGGSVTAVYSYGNSLVARNGEVVLADGLGTTRATVDSTQAVTSTFTTEAFGNTVAQWGSSANPYRFAGAWGYRDDGDAGLLHVGARYYDPQVGRFISRTWYEFCLGRTLGSLHGATEQDISMENGRITTAGVAAVSGGIVRCDRIRPEGEQRAYREEICARSALTPAQR